MIETPIPVNNPAKFTVSFVDEHNAPFDPNSNIRVVVEDSSSNSVTYTYPATLVKESTGIYSVIAEVDKVGYWRAQGSGVLSNGLTVTTPKISRQVI